MKFYLIILIYLISTFTAYANVASTFVLKTPSFKDQSALPKTFTCDGRDISPAFTWSAVPENTQSLAMLIYDIDAPGGTFYHWVLYNIPKSTTSLPENMKKLPPGARLAKNSWGKMEYNGPCPPKGSTHYYIFMLHALNTVLDLPSEATAAEVVDAMQNHIIEKVEVSGTYGRT